MFKNLFENSLLRYDKLELSFPMDRARESWSYLKHDGNEVMVWIAKTSFICLYDFLHHSVNPGFVFSLWGG